MQTIYKVTAGHRNHTGDAPIESLHFDYDSVAKMKHNMEINGWTVVVEWVRADWKLVRDE